jgi:hypothetical protein
MVNAMAKRYTEIAGKIESHWTLYDLVRDNLGWVVTTLGLSGLSGWWAWLWQTATAAPWYEKSLVITLFVLSVAFLMTGLRAFLAWHRRSSREEGAIATGLSWSGHTYANSSIIEGGTHRLAEIFGNDQLRSNLTFRNCQILGPGAIAYFSCHIDKSEFFGLPAVQVIDSRYSGDLSAVVYHFVKCRFENCVFSNILHIGSLPVSGPDVAIYHAHRTTQGSAVINPPAQSPLVQSPPQPPAKKSQGKSPASTSP